MGGFLEDVDPIESFPYKQVYNTPGTYVIKQTSFYSKEMQDIKFYVRMPSVESNIWANASFPDFYVASTDVVNYQYLWIWLAALLVALLFAEWWLHSREGK